MARIGLDNNDPRRDGGRSHDSRAALFVRFVEVAGDRPGRPAGPSAPPAA
ncbi:hypothetical protein ACRAWD_15420 [Caulobacter segnis]